MTKKEFILANNGQTNSIIWDSKKKVWRVMKVINGEQVRMELKTAYMHKVLKDNGIR